MPQPNQIPITSRAALLRALSVEGVSIVVQNHWQTQMIGTTRRPTTVQTNGYWFMAPDRDGNIRPTWADIPKATEMQFHPEGTVTFYPSTPKSWTLAFFRPVTMAEYLATSSVEKQHGEENTSRPQQD